MNNDFRILNECTISFKKDKLYIMLLREFDEFGVEVASKTEGFGRKFAEDKIQATELFNAIVDKLATIKSFEKAKSEVKTCFAFKNINEINFLLNSEDVIRSQSSIGKLRVAFKFKVKAKLNYKGNEKNKGSITIYVYFSKKPIGRFIGTHLGDDFIFERL